MVQVNAGVFTLMVNFSIEMALDKCMHYMHVLLIATCKLVVCVLPKHPNTCLSQHCLKVMHFQF